MFLIHGIFRDARLSLLGGSKNGNLFLQAPRAKMNQQRSRRFRASKETCEKLSEMDRIRSELALKGAFLPPEKPKGEHFDSNCITPVK